MTTKKLNPLGAILRDLFTQISDVFINASKERAVTIGNVWNEVSKHLDETAVYDEHGNRLYPYLVDIYLEESGPFAVINRDGKLFKIPVSIDSNSQITLGEEEPVVMDFKPITARSFSVKRQADGQIRWFAAPACVAVLNRVNEIDSRALFDSFIEHIERDGGAYPSLDFFHLGEDMVLGHADWVARDGFSYLVSGTFEDTDIARAAIKAIEDNPDFWGLSIAYLPTEEPEVLRNSQDIPIPVYNKGINTYVSLLPENTAASVLTSISTKERGTPMKPEVQDALKVLAGGDDELLSAMVAKVDNTNRSATKMVNRAKPSDAKAPVVKATPKAPVAKVEREGEGDEAIEVTDEVIDAVMESPKFQERFNTMLDTALKARTDEAPDDDDVEAEDADESSDEGDESEAGNKEILAELRSLHVRIDDLQKSRDASVEEVLNDLPSRVSRQNIIRPRATRLPDDVRTRSANKGDLDLASIADSILATMGE